MGAGKCFSVLIRRLSDWAGVGRFKADFNRTIYARRIPIAFLLQPEPKTCHSEPIRRGWAKNLNTNIEQESSAWAPKRDLCALVELGHHEFAMAESFGAGEAAAAGAQHDVDQLIAGLVHGHFAAQNSRDVEIDVLAHGAGGFGIGGELD